MASGIDGRCSRQKIFCAHCNDYLPKSTFYRHRDCFFNPVSKEWQKSDADNAGDSFQQRVSCTSDQSSAGAIPFDYGCDDHQHDETFAERESEGTTTSQLEGI